MSVTLLAVFLMPAVVSPFAYFVGRRSVKASALLVFLATLADLSLLLNSVSIILNSDSHMLIESYHWIPMLGATFTLFVDGVSLSMAIITLVLILAAITYSVNYMEGKASLPIFYALLSLLSVGLVGVFITSNLLVFYFCWELMLIPTYFIIGQWGYRQSYRAAFKFFIFTHAGAVFLLLGIGSIYMLTGTLDMFAAKTLLLLVSPDTVRWLLVALTVGFAVKMAVVPAHIWLPDAHSEAPAPMSALLSGVIIEAGAYAIFRVSLVTVYPSVATSSVGADFLHALTIFALISAFYGAFNALVEKDIKRIVAYSSISHMGYVLFGLSLFAIRGPNLPEGVTGGVLHLVNHAASKGLFFLTAGAVMRQTKERNIDNLGGLAGKMPYTTTASGIAALSIAGVPALACFISEFLIFVGGYQASGFDSFYFWPTTLMLVATVFTLAYVLRFFSGVFLGQPKNENVTETPILMKATMIGLAALVILLGVWPSFFLDLINTFTFA